MSSRFGLPFIYFLLTPALCLGGGQHNAREEVVSHVFRIGKDTEHVKLFVEFNEQHLPFIVDTGSTWNIFDESLKPMLGEPVRETDGMISGKIKTIAVYRAPKALAGPLKLDRDADVTVHNFERINRVARDEIRGVIGMSDLKTMRVQIDRDTGKLKILSQLGLDIGMPVTISFPKTGTPRVECSVGRIPGAEFLIDTGQGGSIHLEPKIFDTLLFHHRIRSV